MEGRELRPACRVPTRRNASHPDPGVSRRPQPWPHASKVRGMRSSWIWIPLILVACGPSKPPAPSAPPAPPPVSGAPADPPPPPPPAGPTVEEAKAFVARANAELLAKWSAASLADWERETNVTKETEAVAAKANEAAMVALTGLIRESRTYDPIVDKLDPDTRRQLKLLRTAGSPAPEDPAKATELARVTTEMSSLYATGEACDPKGKKCRDLEKLSDVMADSRQPKELLTAWAGWHKVGRSIRPDFVSFVDLSNEATRGIGFADVGDLWRSRYEPLTPDGVVAEADRLFGQVKPLYEQLHCYVRRKLSKKYGAKVVPATGPMPAHLLGNMWAQDWSNVYELVEPFKGQPQTDVTKAMKRRKYDAVKMTKVAENFFVSLGLPALPETFWTRSLFVQPKGRKVQCHPSAWDPTFNGDVRIKMCIQVKHEDLITLHHELGHDYYYLLYNKLPVLFQDGANDGFHEAIGDTIALSAVTPSYLKQIGLLDKTSVNEKALIDRQMYVALEKIAFLPFGLLVDKWRWEVFAGKVPPAKYTERWWELRREYQGVVPPIERGPEEFDPGAKYHVPANTPYLRYFLAAILQFQFHRSLCKTAGHKGPLHECSIYGSKEAGARLAATLAMGSSRPWPDALEALTGSRELDATAIQEYFAPLMKYLTEQNKGQSCGW